MKNKEELKYKEAIKNWEESLELEAKELMEDIDYLDSQIKNKKKQLKLSEKALTICLVRIENHKNNKCE